MSPDQRQRAFELIEASLWFRPKTRARRLTDSIRDFAEESSSKREQWVGTVLALPILLPSASVALAIEGVHRARIASAYRRSVRRAQERLALIDDVKEQIDQLYSPYRDGAQAKVLAALPPDMVVLFTEGSEGWLIRYTIHAPVEEWPDDRGVEGVCLLVFADSQLLAPFNVWREEGREAIHQMTEALGEAARSCLESRVVCERWTWNHGSYQSLVFEKC